MSISLLRCQVLLDRVTAMCPGYLQIERAITSSDVMDEAGQLRSPAAFVLEPVYTPFGSPDAAGMAQIQMVRLEVGVLTGVKSDRDVLGNDQALALDVVREQLWTAFLGWAPEGQGTMPLVLGVCRPFAFKDGVYWYIDTFSLVRQVRA